MEERTDVNLLIEAPGLEATEEVLLDENEMNYSQLRELQRRTDAAAAFRQAAILCPCFWSAWLELAAALPDADAVNSLDLPNHWMSSFFRAHAALEAQRNVPAISMYEELLIAFPDSPYLQCQLAHARYNLREVSRVHVRSN